MLSSNGLIKLPSRFGRNALSCANEGHLQPVHWYSLAVMKLRRLNHCRTRTYGKILLSDVVKQLKLRMRN